jgi:CHAT domain-containing protein
MVMQWDRFRAGREFVQRHPVQLERSAQRTLQGLFNILFAPIVDLLPVFPDSNQPLPLAIVPHGILHQVPFHALFDGERYLVDTFEISYAPSTTVLTLCQQRPFRNLPPRSLLIGVTDPLIPHVTTEINRVASELEQATIYFDETATKARFQQEAGGYDILHLACHGLFRADSPMFSALRLGDNWLTAVDVMQLDFTGALVTLSACESGRSEVMVGDEMIGLSRAFLGAGAATLVVSLWLVQDDTTATLMTNWYRHWQQGKSRAAALRTAQLALKADFPHPYYWAPFILVGQR